MKGLAIALVILVAAACSSSSPQAATSTRTASEPQVFSTPTPPDVASQRPVTDLPLSSVSFSCRLPVVQSGGDYSSYQGGFVTFPQAKLRQDPAGVISSRNTPYDFATAATPVLHGSGGGFYDLAQKRWVPVHPEQSSPDGAYYAHGVVAPSDPRPPLTIHLVDVALAAERVFTIQTTPAFGNSVGALVLDFDGSSVYFSSMQAMGPPSGVFKLDIRSGAVLEMSKAGGVAFIARGYAWVNRIDPRDATGPLTGRSGPRSNSVVRVDLSTGQETVWYFVSGQMVYIDGLDRDGTPIVAIEPGPDFRGDHAAVRLVRSPQDDGGLIDDDAGGLGLHRPQADSQGRLWFGNDRGIYLYTAAAGLRKIFAFTDANRSEAIIPVGFCL
jgi:hypothetical protein